LANTEYALIVAGGKGTRINSSTPKQFIELGGLPVLIHTLHAFFLYSEKIKIILVLPKDDLETWSAISKKYRFDKPVVIQEGGASRFQSVKRGLEKIEGDGLVAIHDGVRPLVSPEIIAASFRHAAKHRSAVAAVPLKDSIRMSDDGSTKAMDRSTFKLIQTPQTFDIGLIKSAYAINEDSTLTDDASVAERAGHRIHLFEGSYRNLKITTEEDLIVAKALLAAQL
jgi:2-C-methyl-D-erythritol 4-phosphate cytidylyltransferase